MWNLETKENSIVPNPPHWVETSKSRHGNFLVLPDSKNILVVNTSPSITPEVQGYRAAKARTDLWWHEEQAKESESNKDVYSEIFHRARLLIANPQDTYAYIT